MLVVVVREITRGPCWWNRTSVRLVPCRFGLPCFSEGILWDASRLEMITALRIYPIARMSNSSDSRNENPVNSLTRNASKHVRSHPDSILPNLLAPEPEGQASTRDTNMVTA